jgi:hypothetical protein
MNRIFLPASMPIDEFARLVSNGDGSVISYDE